MTHDSDLGHPLQYGESSPKNIGDHDLFESVPLKTEISSEKKKSFKSLGDFLRLEKEFESRENGEILEAYNDMNLDVSTNAAENHSESMIGDTTLSAARKPLTKRQAEFYMDKAVTENERPKMIVCFQKDAYSVVKDICVDEGVHSQLNDKMDHREVFMLSHSQEKERDVSTNKKPTLDPSDSLYVFGSPFHHTDGKNGSVDAKKNEQIEVFSDEASHMKHTSRGAPSGKEFDHSTGQSDLSHAASNSEQLKLDEDDNFITHNCTRDQEQENQGLAGKLEKMSLAANSSTEVNSESENSIYVPSNSAPGRTEINSDVKSERNFEPRQLVETNIGISSAEESTDSTPALSQSSAVHYGKAASVMHGPGCLSDRISHTGQMAYSGSVSIRSDSSTTSTRSFAFPILQTEWNCSPVKMAKADRRHYRKHRSWKAGVLCCRF